jgi:hypothetical protein
MLEVALNNRVTVGEEFFVGRLAHTYRPNFFANWPFSRFFSTFMPLAVSFQKMDP